MLVFDTISDFKSIIGKELPVGNWYVVTQEMITDFANATLDKQWIHVDEARAVEESPFKSTIAHGFMSVSMISKLLEEVFTIKSLKMGMNYLGPRARGIKTTLIARYESFYTYLYYLDFSNIS
jgi:acyl dehydratase